MSRSRIIAWGIATLGLIAVLVAPLMLFNVAPKDKDGNIKPLAEVTTTPNSTETPEVSETRENGITIYSGPISGEVVEKYTDSGDYLIDVSSSELDGVYTKSVNKELYDAVSVGTHVDITTENIQ